MLAQTSTDNTGGRFPRAVYERSNLKNGEASVKFKPVSGKVDQAAGVVWRYRDPNRYELARANADEDCVYKVEGGKRISLAPKGTPSKTYGVKHRAPTGAWGTLRVTFQGAVFTVYMNCEKLFEVDDSTFPRAGKVGLWTKADGVTCFDDFEFK